jgi:hypothetical protein
VGFTPFPPTADRVQSAGSAFTFVVPLVTTNFTLINVPDVTTDLMVSRNVLDPSGLIQTSNKIIVRRSQNPGNLETRPVVDFNAALILSSGWESVRRRAPARQREGTRRST